MFFRSIGLIIALALPWSATAAEISGKLVVGEQIQWDADPILDYWLPNNPEPSTVSQVVTSVVPSSPDSSYQKPRLLKLKSGESSAEILVTVQGMWYQLTRLDGFSDRSGSTATTRFLSGNRVTTIGYGYGTKSFWFYDSTKPFVSYSPIVDFDINDGFKDKPTGIYTGTMNINVPYQQEVNGRWQKAMLTVPLTVRIEYTAATLASIDVTGSDILEPNYSGEYVSGKTEYTIKARGVFPNGVSVGLKRSSDTDGIYRLKPQKGGSTEILYDVTCIECQNNNQFIQNGVAKIDNISKLAKLNNGTKQEQTMHLNVSYKDKKLSELESDVYQGAFVLVFEAGL
ncbi:hypothetical protein [Vibrio campbellii]|uniref:hypothetical protein n=1 Tax=Vibrio campbellii TaxID=680 RepID=UPI0038CD2DD3